MPLEKYIVKGGQRLRLGYTTGSCAAAAAGAAAAMLVSGRQVPQMRLQTPKGIDLVLEIEDVHFFGREGEIRAVSCAVRKDSGDDPDVTNGALIYARVARSREPGIRIDGGEGVGRVTKPGLDQPVGRAAINSTPRRMIEEAVRRAADPAPGFDVTIYVPQGRELAEKTFNPKLGIVGGISILGTSGIVEPMSEQALLDTIRAEIRVRAAEKWPILPAAPGNYGKNFFLENYGFSLDTAVTSSNFIYDTVKMAEEAGFRRMLFVGHIGKLVKVAGGVRNTHSKYGDRRMEILETITEDVLKSGILKGGISWADADQVTNAVPGEDGRSSDRRSSDGKSNDGRPSDGRSSDGKSNDGRPIDGKSGDTGSKVREALSACVTTDEAVRVLQTYDLAGPVLSEMTRRIQSVMQAWTEGRMQVEVIVFSNVFGELGRTGEAASFLEKLRKMAPADNE